MRGLPGGYDRGTGGIGITPAHAGLTDSRTKTRK